jgi:hypothetical protein
MSVGGFTRRWPRGPLTEATPEDNLAEPEISGEPRISKHGGNRASGWWTWARPHKTLV